MRSRIFLPLGVLIVGMLGTVMPASAYYQTNSYNLECAEIRGYVESVEDQVAYIQTDDGEVVAVQLGPESYWNAHHYYLPEGEYIEMDVWYDPLDQYTEWYFAGEIWGPGFHFVLTNNDGVPYWVIFNDDYYYSLGYRASCVSYMVWYDCPPIYFVYLILPPPPPRTYICFYGPHWWDHHFDWHYGPRYCSGGSYWNDGRGYERPRRPGKNPRWHDGSPHGDNSISHNDSFERSGPPATPPMAKQQPRKNEIQDKWPIKPQSKYNRKVAVQRKEYQKQTVASIPPAERKVTAIKHEQQMRPIRLHPNDHAKQDVHGSNILSRKALMTKGNSPNIQVLRPPRSEKDPSAVERAKSLKRGNR